MRELAIIRSAQLNGGFYEEAQHRPMALSCGLEPAQLDAIRHWTGSSEFSHAQRALLGYVDAMFQADGPSDETYAAAVSLFSTREMVELTFIAAMYAGFRIFTRALRTPLEPIAGRPGTAYGVQEP